MGKPATLRVDIVTDSSKASRGLDNFGSRVGRMGTAVKAGAAAAGIAVAALTVQAVKSASHLQQSVGATEAIFGRYSRSVQKQAKAAATAVGLSKADYLDLANVLGSQLKNAGTPVSKLADKTRSLIGVGSDMAAVFGGTTKDAVDAVSSALKGELDPIERYGVSIKQSDVNTLLAARGQSKLSGTALKAAQSAAVLDLVTKQTAATHGQFAKQTGTVAEQAQIMGAKWENIKATLGTALLPVLSALMGFISGTVLPGIERFIAVLGGGGGAGGLGQAVAGVGGFIRGTLVPMLSRLWGFIVGKVVPAVKVYLTSALQGGRAAFASIAAAVQRNRPLFEGIGVAIKKVAEFALKYLVPVLAGSLKLQLQTIGKIIGGVIDTIGGLYNGIAALIRKIGELVDKIKSSKVGELVGGIGKGIGKVGGAIGSVFGSRVTASALTGSTLTAAAGGGGGGGIAVNVAPSLIVVKIGERELHAVVDERVDYGIGRAGRRISGRVAF
jgi:hypothetical protein